MEKMINLKDLLKHEILDLYSAEEQIIEAMPAMIDKAQNANLKKALQQHLKITEEQKKRLDKAKQLISKEEEQQAQAEEKKGFFSRLFGGANEKEKCKGMEGLITEGEKIMGEDISPEALDAAIIASAQKIEHYEISGYGTARAFARELKLKEVEQLLEQTLNEEYEADDRLTELAVGKLNLEAENATDTKVQAEKPASTSRRSETRHSGKETSERNGSIKAEAKESRSTDERKQTSPRADLKKSSTKANTSKSEASPKKKATKSASNNKKRATRSASASTKTSSKSKTSSRSK
jgi:ferritin-like metal-binding protein YciE